MTNSEKKLPELNFVQKNGAKVHFYPTWEARDELNSGAGSPEFYYEVRGEPGDGEEFLLARFKIKAEVRGRGKDMKLVVILTADEGQPIQIHGKEWNHEFSAKLAAFSPDRSSITINGMTEKGFRVEVPEADMRHMELHGVLVKPPGELY